VKRSAEQVVRELAALPQPGLDATELGEALSRAIRPLVAHDGLRMVGRNANARIALGSFSFVHGYEPEFGRALYRGLLAGEDPYPLDVLKHRSVPGAVVGHRRYGRYELRMVLRDAKGIWGTVGLLRDEDSFAESDTISLNALTSALVDVLRRHVTGTLFPVGPTLPSGVFMLDSEHRIRAATTEAECWHERLRSAAAPEWTLDAGLAILSREARAGRPSLIVGPAASYGHWVAMQGQVLGDDVAVIVQQANGELLLPPFCDWYGLTTRERQIVTRLYDGSAPKQVARQLQLSVHTVNEHLTAVYRKTGAVGRDELVAAISG
jgi:DNA-binding CsgD family transcriptional regulator